MYIYRFKRSSDNKHFTQKGQYLYNFVKVGVKSQYFIRTY